MHQMSVSALEELVASIVRPGTRFDLVAARPSPRLKTRLRPFTDARRELGVPFSLGFEDLKHIPSAIVVVMFTDVAVDYYIRDEFTPLLARTLKEKFGEPVCYTDRYRILRKEFATLAGMGKIGRNGLFFSRKFGFNCKIDVILTKVEFDAYSELKFEEWQLGPCADCNDCVPACPVNAYDNFVMHNWKACDDLITPLWDQPEKMCRNCITSCPASNTVLQRLYDRGMVREKRLDLVESGTEEASVDALYTRIPQELQDLPNFVIEQDSPWLPLPTVEKRRDHKPAEIWEKMLPPALKTDGVRDAFTKSKIPLLSIVVAGEGGGAWTISPSAVVKGKLAPVAMEFQTPAILSMLFYEPYNQGVLDRCLQRRTIRFTGTKTPAENEAVHRLVSRLMFAAHGDRQFY